MATEPTTVATVNGAALSPLDVLTLAQAAAYVQLPEDVLRTEAEAGRVVGRQSGSEWRFVREDIIQWLRSPQPARRPMLKDLPPSDETEEEYQAFMANIAAHRDQIDRETGSGKYAPE